MIHDPLLNIDKLQEKSKQGILLTELEWKSIRDDMNSAVCFFLRLQERGALSPYKSLDQAIKLFLNSR